MSEPSPVVPETPSTPSWWERTKAWWARTKDSYTALFEEYGAVAVGTYFTIFFGTLFAFILAVRMGFQPQSATAETGTVVVAYVATKATQPLRIVATLVLTPLVARFIRRLRRASPPASPGSG